MNIEVLKDLYLFELGNLHKEISAYRQEKNLWIVDGQVNNSAGNLCLHLTGGLQHFIGATLGNTGYVRDRDNEFSAKGKPREELLQHIEQAKQMVSDVMSRLTEAQLDENYKFDFMGVKPTRFYLTRFLAHLSYHLGQVSYHRRLLDV